MLILGIETSCDETAVAVEENWRQILSKTVTLVDMGSTARLKSYGINYFP